MRTKIVVFAGAAAIALLATGCTDQGAPVAAPSAEKAASSAPTAGSTSKPVVTAVTTAKPQPKPSATGDAGDGGNWFGALAACRFAEQKTEVQKLVLADVTGDGVADALVARTCETTTSYWPSTVEVFDGTTGEAPKRIGTLLGDAGAADLPWFQSMSVSGRTVTVKAYGTSKDAPRACPDLKLTYKYSYSDGKFTRVGRQATEATGCLRIQ
jgi:hypothetical protein